VHYKGVFLDGYLLVVFVYFFLQLRISCACLLDASHDGISGARRLHGYWQQKVLKKGGSFGRVREPWIVWKVWKVGSWLIDGSSQFLLNQDTAEAIMARSTREAMIEVGNAWLVMCLIYLG
jgi:hypothetical protein